MKIYGISDIFFDDATSAIIGKTECLKTSLCPSYQLSWVAQGIPQFL
jgi:hypothetical protein